MTDINAETNTVKIGRGGDLLRKELIAGDVNLIGLKTLNGGLRVHAQVRYKDTASPATVFAEADGKLRVLFDEPKRAITPGQSVVIYDGERLLGGGVIEKII